MGAVKLEREHCQQKFRNENPGCECNLAVRASKMESSEVVKTFQNWKLQDAPKNVMILVLGAMKQHIESIFLVLIGLFLIFCTERMIFCFASKHYSDAVASTRSEVSVSGLDL